MRRPNRPQLAPINFDMYTMHEANAMQREADRQFVKALRRKYPEYDPARFDALRSTPKKEAE